MSYLASVDFAFSQSLDLLLREADSFLFAGMSSFTEELPPDLLSAVFSELIVTQTQVDATLEGQVA
jgi:hypothetical protein